MFSLLPTALLASSVLFPSTSALPERPDARVRRTDTVEMVATGWYAGWHADDFPVSNISWDKYTHLTYAFAVTTPDPTQISLQDSDKALLPTFVSTAHQNGVKALLTIGGWTGSLFFSTNVGSEENRTAFAKSVTDLASQYSLDGIDFDWEYPNRQGIGCNAISANDTDNFLAFLRTLRNTTVGSNLILSAAVSISPFVDASGNASTDVSAFASVLDFVAVMNYDVWGSWSASVGPNAPLNDTCAPPAGQQGSAVSAVRAWTAAGMPSSQIVLGVPSYGHSFNVTPTDAFANGSLADGTLGAYPPFNASAHPVGDAWDGAPAVDVCGVLEPQGGIWDFWGLIAGGFLNADGSVAPGIGSRFDNCSQTAYVYNATAEVMVSYDSAETFRAKGAFIKENNLRGFGLAGGWGLE